MLAKERLHQQGREIVFARVRFYHRRPERVRLHPRPNREDCRSLNPIPHLELQHVGSGAPL